MKNYGRGSSKLAGLSMDFLLTTSNRHPSGCSGKWLDFWIKLRCAKMIPEDIIQGKHTHQFERERLKMRNTKRWIIVLCINCPLTWLFWLKALRQKWQNLVSTTKWQNVPNAVITYITSRTWEFFFILWKGLLIVKILNKLRFWSQEIKVIKLW